MGARPDTKASKADALATGTASRVTHLMPARLSSTKAITRPIASTVTGAPGRYHSCIAEAERIAVMPQVGTQPHQ